MSEDTIPEWIDALSTAAALFIGFGLGFIAGILALTAAIIWWRDHPSWKPQTQETRDE